MAIRAERQVASRADLRIVRSSGRPPFGAESTATHYALAAVRPFDRSSVTMEHARASGGRLRTSARDDGQRHVGLGFGQHQNYLDEKSAANAASGTAMVPERAS